MGTSSSGAEFSAKINRFTAELSKLPTELERRNARTAEAALGAAVRQMSGGDGRLSRVGSGKGAPVGVKTRPAGGGRVNVSPKGPVMLVENDTTPHLVGAGRGRTTTRGGREFVQGLTKSYNLDQGQRLNIGGSWVTGPVIHPGTRGAGLWKRTRDQVLPKLIVADAHRAMAATVRAAF